MLRTFVEVPLFTKRWKEIGLGDDELRALQIMLLKDPESGPVMEGTGGIRKVRFSLENRGKSGGIRVCYTDFAEYEVDTMAFDPAGCTDSRFYNSISHSDDCEKQLL